MTAAFLVSLAGAKRSRRRGLRPRFIVASTAPSCAPASRIPQLLLLAMVGLGSSAGDPHPRAQLAGGGLPVPAWREAWGRPSSWQLLQIYLLQGTVILVVVAPVLLVMADPVGPRLRDAAGVLVWCVGLLFEAVGDLQVLRHQRDPAQRGRVLQTGSGDSRGTNYFGERPLVGVLLVALGRRSLGRRRRPAHDPFPAPQSLGIPMLEAKFAATGVRRLRARTRLSSLDPGRRGRAVGGRGPGGGRLMTGWLKSMRFHRAFFAIDMLWLGSSPGTSTAAARRLLADQVNWRRDRLLPALHAGIVFFVTLRRREQARCAGAHHGAFFGLVAYATYD